MAKVNSLTHIGAKEYVTFPSPGVRGVPAKTDTGADSSSVWATDIRQEKDGRVSFKLFGPGSKYYTGEILFADTFKITQITNSFGHQEERYKVKITAVIAGRRIRVGFTLADRSRNRYPILIGRNTLHNRFIVDVSKNNVKALDGARRVLILDSRPSEHTQRLVGEMNRAVNGLEVDSLAYSELVISLGGDGGIDISSVKDGSSLADYDLIYFRTYLKAAEMAAAVAEYAQLHGINFIDSEAASYHAYTKLSQYARLARMGLPIPRSLIIDYRYLADKFDFFESMLGMPFVLKDVAADRGEANFLISSKADFRRVAERALSNKACYVGQEYIENDGDYRMIVLNKEMKFAIERKRQNTTTHLNNTSQGAQARLLEPDELPSSVNALAVKSAIAMGRQVAGVDLMRNKVNGEWVVLEVNSTPQLASGAYVERKITELGSFLLKYAGK